MAAAIGFGLASASATETVSCSGVGGSDAMIEMNVGSGLPVTFVSWVRVGAGGETWSTLRLDSEAVPVNVYQAFDEPDMLRIDIADEPVSEVVMKIRILRAGEGENIVRAGTLHIVGHSVHAVLCDFGEGEGE
jgi:hypothetical protein